MANIYLATKEGSYDCQVTSNVKVKITASKKNFNGCKNFEVVTYDITYDSSYNTKFVYRLWGSYFNLYIYTGYDYYNMGAYPYAFYWPKTNNDIVKQVDSYYSLLNPYTPVAIVFTTRAKKDNQIYYSYQSLLDTGYNYYNLKGTKIVNGKIKGETLTQNITKDWKKAYRGVTFHNTKGISSDIKRIPDDGRTFFYIGTKNEFYKINFMSTTDGKKPKLHPDKWFSKIKENVYIHEFTSGSDTQYDGIIGYYSFNDKEPLLIECFNGCEEKTQYVRKDKDGFYWEKRTISYDGDENLAKQLETIKTQSQENITFLLHKNDKYGDNIQLSHENKKLFYEIYYHTIYKHTPKVEKHSLLLYQNSLFVNKDKSPDVLKKKYKDIEVYTLDVSNGLHLLVKLTENESSGTDVKVNYYFRVNKEVNEWKNKEVSSQDYSKNLGIILYDIYFNFGKSIIIEVHQHGNIQYPCKIVDNRDSDTRGSPVKDLKISVTEQKQCIDGSEYKCYLHDVTECSSEIDALSGVLGLRLYDNSKEIEIYKDDKKDNRTYLHYVPGTSTSKKLYAYLDGTSNKLLLVCYDRKAYKAKCKGDHKLILDNCLSSCECTSRNKDEIKKKLEEIKKGSCQESIDESVDHSVQGCARNRGNASIGTDIASGGNGKSPGEVKSQDGGRNTNPETPSEGRIQKKDPLSEFWEENKIYVYSGGGAALGAGSIIGISVLIYKKCLKVTAAVATNPLL